MSITTSIAQAMQSFIDPELDSPSSTTSQHLPPPSYDPQNPDSLFLIAFAARHPLLSSSPPASARSSMESIDFEDNRYRLFSSSLFSGDDDDFDYTPTPTTPGQPLIPVWPEELQIVEEPTPMLPEVEVPLSPPTTPGCATPIRSDEEFGVVKPDPRRSHRREKSWRGTMKRLFTRRSL